MTPAAEVWQRYRHYTAASVVYSVQGTQVNETTSQNHNQKRL